MKKITFVGAGSMAEAMVAGIVHHQIITKEQIWITNRSDQNRLKSLVETYGIQSGYDLHELLHDADIVVLAMKPKDAAAAIHKIKPFVSEQSLVVSVLAGVSITSIEHLLGKKCAVVRAMPNTSAAIGKSATALAFNSVVTKHQLSLVEMLFKTVGLVTFVDEKQLDAVTGLSGSGPAYVYYLVEAMEKSAIEIGLEPQTAKQLILQTIIGAAEMLNSTTKTPNQLRKEVTSPGGTTEAGISILEQFSVQDAFINCIKEATLQSERLGTRIASEMIKV